MRVERGIQRMPNTKDGEARFQARYFVGYSMSGKRVYRARLFATVEEARQWYLQRRTDRVPSPNAELEWPERWMKSSYSAVRSGAKDRGISFELTFDEYAEMVRRADGHCMLTGIRFEFQNPGTKTRRRPFVPSLDRIDCTKGYSKDNCRLICAALNYALGDWGMEPLMRIARSLVMRETLKLGRVPVAHRVGVKFMRGSDARIFDETLQNT